LLGAGLELVARRSLGDTLAHLRINDLARAADLTSGAFYHYWDNQEAYRSDVLAVLLSGDRPDAAADLWSQGDDPADDPAATLRRAVARAGHRLADGADLRLELALWAHDDPAAHEGLRRRAQRTDGAWATALGSFLDRVGRRPAPGWDLPALATTAVATSDGLRMQALIDPAVVARPVPVAAGPWSRAAVLALLLIAGTTEAGRRRAGDVDPGVGVVDDDGAPAAGPPGRQRLLELGVTAARRQPTGNAFDHIRADDVARHLDLTIGAFYHYWESQDDYRDDLVDALFAADRYVDPDDVAARLDEVAAAPGLAEAYRDATTWYWRLAAGNPANRVLFGFHALDDPYITTRLATAAADLRGAWHVVVDTLLERFDRRLRPPLDTDLVVLGMGAAIDGLLIRHGLDPEGLEPDEEGWTRWGRACFAMIDAASAEAGDDRDLAAWARDTLGP
jgi:AcrR family transcriptional regulator